MIGVISDTHGLLRPAAIEALRGVEHILHAGDVGDASILDSLRRVAPVTAIRGNVDVGGPCSHLPATEVVTLHGHTLYMLHDRQALDLDPVAAGFSAVITGHSHKPLLEWRHGVLYMNPGSAGPRRFSLPVSIGLLTIGADGLQPRLVTLR
ncbi:MAG: metallophosphoesterase family protein [Acidobacteriaceae bacterium]